MDVVLVDKDDNFIGYEEKIKAHKEALLHRAFSLLIFNNKGEMLIHKRASNKYHCPGLWTNACCSHPSLEKDITQGIKKRLIEEMGMQAKDYKELFKFTYKKEFDNGLTEHEIDRVFVAFSEEIPKPNPDEVQDYKWVKVENLYKEVNENKDKYTFWFKEILNNEKFKEFVRENDKITSDKLC